VNRDLVPGKAVVLAPGVRRVLAPNPGLMTGPGTNTYLLGASELAVIDPGPAIESHVDAIVAVAGGPIRWILVTHTHPDHSPGAAALARKTGAALIGQPAAAGPHQDGSFQPGRIPRDGETITMPEFALEAIHTPGHASNHTCYRHVSLKWLFTGDHIIDGSTVVIDPSDGNMAHYLESLERLKQFDIAAIAPGHGSVIEHPRDAIDWLIDHRLQREAKVVAALAAHPGSTLAALVHAVYDDVDAALHPLAERSLLAHLEKLRAESSATFYGNRWWPISE
jgi:glyoxylase-like metal-dependent hydrolase (beta-lactamase superfamily II)